MGYANEAFDDGKKLDKDESRLLDDDIPEYNCIPDDKTESELSEERLWLDRVASGGRRDREELPCQVVEVKAKEIVRSVVTEIESLIVPGPTAVEMVHVDDTDTEPESGSPAIVRRKAEEPAGQTPSKIPKRVLKQSPNVQKKVNPDRDEKFPENVDFIRKPKRKSLEITLRKEVEMRRTYELVSASLDSDDVFMDTAPQVKRPEDVDSFYGSDKENDAAVEFSADEEESRMIDSDSSDDDSQVVSFLFCNLAKKHCLIDCYCDFY